MFEMWQAACAARKNDIDQNEFDGDVLFSSIVIYFEKITGLRLTSPDALALFRAVLADQDWCQSVRGDSWGSTVRVNWNWEGGSPNDYE